MKVSAPQRYEFERPVSEKLTTPLATLASGESPLGIAFSDSRPIGLSVAAVFIVFEEPRQATHWVACLWNPRSVYA